MYLGTYSAPLMGKDNYNHFVTKYCNKRVISFYLNSMTRRLWFIYLVFLSISASDLYLKINKVGDVGCY
jgi:hypothetical protein